MKNESTAFPFKGINTTDGFEDSRGMSKRFYAACAAMQGILANEQGFLISEHETTRENLKNKVKFAYMCADELLKQE